MPDYRFILPSPDFKIIVNPEEMHELPPAIESHVESLWEKACRSSSGKMFNGRLLSALSISRWQIVGRFIDYKHYAACFYDPSLQKFLKINPVAVSGLTTSGDSLLLGKRSLSVNQNKGLWEFIPSGTIDPDSAADNRIDWKKAILKELEEEAGISSSYVRSLKPFLIACGREFPATELCIGIKIDQEIELKSASWEYDSYRWIPIIELKNNPPLAKDAMVPLSFALLSSFLNTCHFNSTLQDF